MIKVRNNYNYYKEILNKLEKKVHDLYFKQGINYDIYASLKDALNIFIKVSDILYLYYKHPSLFILLGRRKKLEKAEKLLDNSLVIYSYNLDCLVA